MWDNDQAPCWLSIRTGQHLGDFLRCFVPECLTSRGKLFHVSNVLCSICAKICSCVVRMWSHQSVSQGEEALGFKGQMPYKWKVIACKEISHTVCYMWLRLDEEKSRSTSSSNIKIRNVHCTQFRDSVFKCIISHVTPPCLHFCVVPWNVCRREGAPCTWRRRLTRSQRWSPASSPWRRRSEPWPRPCGSLR